MSVQEESSLDSMADRTSKDMMFEPKPRPKMIRILTVLAYVLSVSMAAILLSIYYIFVWDGRPHIGHLSSELADGMVEIFENRTGSLTNSTLANYIVHTNQLENLRENVTTDEPTTSASLLTEIIVTTEMNAKSSDRKKSRSKRNLHFIQEWTDREMQQQFTAIETETLKASTVPPTTTTDESVTLSDDYESLEDLKKSSILIEKIIENESYDDKYFLK